MVLTFQLKFGDESITKYSTEFGEPLKPFTVLLFDPSYAIVLAHDVVNSCCGVREAKTHKIRHLKSVKISTSALFAQKISTKNA